MLGPTYKMMKGSASEKNSSFRIDRAIALFLAVDFLAVCSLLPAEFPRYFMLLVSLYILGFLCYSKRITFGFYFIFFFYVLLRALFNIFEINPLLFEASITASVQLASVALLAPATYWTLNASGDVRKKNILNSIVFFGYCHSVILVLSLFGFYLVSQELYETYGARNFGILGDQLAFILSFLVAISLQDKKILQSLFFVGCLLLTGSLAAFSIAVICIVYFLVKITSISGLTFAFLGVSGLIFLDSVGFGGWNRLTSGGYLETFGLRAESLRVALDIDSNPIFGSGHGTYSIMAQSSMSNLLDLSGSIYANSYNQIVQIYSDLGILGLSFYFLFVIKFIMLKTAKCRMMKVWGLSILIFHQSTVWLLPGSYTWLIFSIVVGFCYYDDRVLRAAPGNV